jgi:exopolysaccharide biosynthesis polyprenyl glycosylphosphotransferase
VFKRVCDVAGSLVGLSLAAPLGLAIAALIKLDSPGPILYRQERVGEGGRPFTLLKFRSMGQDAEAATGPVWATDDDGRATRLGKWLRKFRLDELPQMINVLRGDMSFVGPRPERPWFVEDLKNAIPYYGLRHAVKPGITGWAQVRYHYGSNVQDTIEKLQYDLYYIKNMSILLDATILVQTVQTVVLGRGAR